MSRSSAGLVLMLMAGGCKNKLPNSAEVVTVPVTVKTSDRTIAFKGAGGVALEGSLMLPPGELESKRPAVLLISGSGPTDRDGNQPGLKPDTLKQFAKGLAAAGIVTFRFDKRAAAKYAGQWPKDSEKVGSYFSWSNHVGDAIGAWNAMRSDGAVDATRCAILGHSEGGLIALAMTRQATPRALVLAATPARTFDTLIKEQLSERLASMGQEGKDLLAANDRISAEVRSTGRVPKDVPFELKALYNPSVGVYFQEVSKIDPVKLARAFTRPVLVLNGADDAQVSPERDAKLLFEAVRSNAESRLLVLPLTSHNFKPVEKRTDLGFAGAIVPDAVEAVQEFLVAVIGGKVPSGQTEVD